MLIMALCEALALVSAKPLKSNSMVLVSFGAQVPSEMAETISDEGGF